MKPATSRSPHARRSTVIPTSLPRSRRRLLISDGERVLRRRDYLTHLGFVDTPTAMENSATSAKAIDDGRGVSPDGRRWWGERTSLNDICALPDPAESSEWR